MTCLSCRPPGGLLYGEKATQLAQTEGQKLWKAIQHAIELRVQMRQAEDPEYGALLNRFAVGRPSLEDLLRLNTRVISEDNVPPDGTMVAVPFNKDREQLNSIAFRRFVLAKRRLLSASQAANMAAVPWTHIGALRVIMSTQEIVHGVPQDITSRRKKAAIMRLPESMRRRLPFFLDLILEQQFAVSHNVCVSKGVANGTSGMLTNVLLHDGAVRWSNKAGCHVVDARDVVGVVVKNLQPPFDAESHYPPLAKGHFPLQCLDSRRARGPLHLLIDGKSCHITAELKQLPLVPVFCLTGQKIS